MWVSDHHLWQLSIWAQIGSYCVATAAASVAAFTYRTNSRRERAKWAVQLYEKFFEEGRYKAVRELLDCEANATDVADAVREEDSDFTDYLNFFEMVMALVETRQLSKADVLRLFQYYLQCLKRHDNVMRYLDDRTKGYESLRDFIEKTEI